MRVLGQKELQRVGVGIARVGVKHAKDDPLCALQQRAGVSLPLSQVGLELCIGAGVDASRVDLTAALRPIEAEDGFLDRGRRDQWVRLAFGQRVKAFPDRSLFDHDQDIFVLAGWARQRVDSGLEYGGAAAHDRVDVCQALCLSDGLGASGVGAHRCWVKVGIEFQFLPQDARDGLVYARGERRVAVVRLMKIRDHLDDVIVLLLPTSLESKLGQHEQVVSRQKGLARDLPVWERAELRVKVLAHGPHAQ